VKVCDDKECDCRLEELARLVGVWRSARCMTPGPDMTGRGLELCDGENHLAACVVELARQDVIAAHNTLGAPGMP
jgi:hypothetical protein